MNSVSAAVTDERLRPAVRTRRTEIGVGRHRFDMDGTEFADLARDPAPVTVGGRLYSPANLVATVADGLLRAAGPAPGAVITCPAAYSGKQVALLRQALDLSGLRDVLLVPEPVAAAEWLEFEQGPLAAGFVLVYDLGGTSLDVTLVRVGPDWTDHPVIGRSLRSYEYGGRPFGGIIARYARIATSDGLVSSVPPGVVEDLRIAHVRKSFGLVRDCLRASGRTVGDIDRVLVVGGAARPPEVAETLAELGRPVVMSSDPGQCCAAGAAHFAARVFAPADTESRAPRVAVFSSAAVASALAMSAATVFGGSADHSLSPVLEILPGTDVLTDTLLYDPSGDTSLDQVIRHGGTAVRDRTVTAAAPLLTGFGRLVTSGPGGALMGPTIAESRGGHDRSDAHRCCTAVRDATLYANPAAFVNPLPFKVPIPKVPAEKDPRTNPDDPNTGTSVSDPSPRIPEVSLPASRDERGSTHRGGANAGDRANDPGAQEAGTDTGGGNSGGTTASGDGTSTGDPSSSGEGTSSGPGGSTSHGSDTGAGGPSGAGSGEGSSGTSSGGEASGPSGGGDTSSGASGGGGTGASGSDGSGGAGGTASGAGGSDGPSSGGPSSGGASSGTPSGASPGGGTSPSGPSATGPSTHGPSGHGPSGHGPSGGTGGGMGGGLGGGGKVGGGMGGGGMGGGARGK